MARAAVRTLIPLDRFASVLGIHPLHWNQVVIPTEENPTVCDQPVVQYPWMAANKTSREDVAEALANAEENIRLQLRFPIAPTWIRDEEQPYPRPANPTLISGWDRDVRGFVQTLRADQGYIISGGIEAKTLIGNAAVAYSDTDGDGYKETATISIATSVTDDDEIAVYYPSKSGEDAWEIRPLQSVSITGGVVTIVCRREQLVIATLQEGYSEAASRSVDGTNDANFLTTVDVYRHWNDPSTQVQMRWDTLSWCGCSGETECTTCGFGIQNGCMVVRDGRLGIVAPQPGTWDAATSVYNFAYLADCRAPDRVQLSYRAGYRDARLARPMVNVASRLERATVFYALGMLERPLCGCQTLESMTRYWRSDLAGIVSTQAATTSHQLTDNQRNCPLGTTRGALYAWNIVEKMRRDDA